MADINEAGLPIKSPGNTDDKVESQLVDGTVPTLKAAIDIDGNLHIEAHGNDPAGLDVVARLSELGAVNSDGDYDAANNTKPASTGMIAHDRATTPADTDQNQRITAVTNATVHALDMAMHTSDGAPVNSANPLPVAFSPDPDGTEVHDYNTAAAVAAAATSNHDYSVANGTTARLMKVECSASSRAKWELQVGDGGVTEVFTTVAVKFTTEDQANAVFDFRDIPKKVLGTANTTTIRVIRTNRDDDDAMDMYSTIMVNEI